MVKSLQFFHRPRKTKKQIKKKKNQRIADSSEPSAVWLHKKAKREQHLSNIFI